MTASRAPSCVANGWAWSVSVPSERNWPTSDGCSTWTWSVRRVDEPDADVERVDLDELLATSDVVQLCVPLTDSTRSMIGEAQFAAMKPGALLVNTSRGAVVDHVALADALARNSLGGYATDVWDPEPPSADDPLWSDRPCARDAPRRRVDRCDIPGDLRTSSGSGQRDPHRHCAGPEMGLPPAPRRARVNRRARSVPTTNGPHGELLGGTTYARGHAAHVACTTATRDVETPAGPGGPLAEDTSVKLGRQRVCSKSKSGRQSGGRVKICAPAPAPCFA